MGNKIVTFTEEQLEDYQDCTFFTRKEILRVFKKFRELNPSIVPKSMTANEPMTVRLPLETVAKMAELKENPFRHRICQVFSRDGNGISFEDFLDIFSAFSEHAPRDIKVYYAFRIYDFDGDQFLGTGDLEQTLKLLTRDELAPDEVALVSVKVLEEADVDDDGKLSFGEFEHVITRSPDFLANFHIRI
ncbi:calcium and integrin-binding family member 3 [Folsomia candida]|uniref:Calcium and integrin-binding family member 3 n=1 Tax=Folsomia candida TaxID=158441 RepID=A0A226DF25_FOLCA|nr:calcium and integrin-binding family member 3 [Folsomia candida]OXA43769.1 Calcium and integrin-binding family member 3 [Folsomia candida]